MKLIIKNYIDLERVESDTVILQGHVDSTDTVSHLRVAVQTKELSGNSGSFSDLGSVRVIHNSFSAVIQLAVGTNWISFFDQEDQVVGEIRLVYEHCVSSDSFLVQPLVVYHESDTFDVTRQKSYVNRIATGLRIVQWFFSEKLVEAGFSRKTFLLASSSLFQVSITPDFIRSKTSTEVWECIAQEIRKDSRIWSDRVKYVAFIMHPWKRDESLENSSIFALEPRSAVAGGGLVLLDHKVLTTWPESLRHVFPALENDRKVPEADSLSPLFSTVSQEFGVSLGIVAHEIGHVFDLGHDSTGLMGKDFQHFALSLRPKLKSTVRGHTKRVYLTSGKIYDDPVQLSQASLTLLYYNRWFQFHSTVPNSLPSSHLDSGISLDKNLISSDVRLTVIQVREVGTANTIGSWTSESVARLTFSLSKRFVPRDWSDKSLELIVQNVSGHVLKTVVDFSKFPEGPTVINRLSH